MSLGPYVSKSVQLFQVFDKNGNGRISMAELGEMLTNLGKNVPTKVLAGQALKTFYFGLI